MGVGDPGRGDGVVALTLDDLRGAKEARVPVVRFDDLLAAASAEAAADVERADEVLVRPSMWRGYSFIALCEWIVCAKLGRPGSHVRWEVPARGGATGVRKVLTDRAWEFKETKGEHKRQRVFEGPAPDAGAMPPTRSFLATLGPHELRFEADWGVFSLGHVDEGTRVLFEAASALRPASVADVGTGYGAVAVGLAAAGDGARVTGSDVDLVALHLARRNAEHNGVHVEVVCDDDPSALAPTELTTCEIPTHVPPGQTQRLVGGLAGRSKHGTVLIAVHNGLVDRYQRLFADAGAQARVQDGDTHAVLSLGG